MLPSLRSSLSVRALAAIGALVLATALLGSLTSRPAGAASPEVERHVIVQFAGAPALAERHGLAATTPQARQRAGAAVVDAHRALVAEDARIVSAIKGRGVAARLTESYTYTLNGAAMTVPASDLAALRSTPGVVHVYPDAAVSASELDPALKLIKAPQVWSRHDSAGSPTDGRGEIVAVVDTGIDYEDADLGEGFGPGHKVVAGYDFVNGDADPMDDNGHGTHVAGIIAGSPAERGGITGVAPGATLTAYKVLDDQGDGNESTIIAGLEDAVAPTNPYRADVVNMSLGLHADSSDPLEQAAHTTAESGVVVVTAAGNDGPGEGSSASPGDAAEVLSVGATFSGVDLPDVSVASPVHRHLVTGLVSGSANPPSGGETVPVVDVGNGSPDSYDGLNVAGKAVMMTYPPINDWDSSMAAAAAHGVAAVIVYTPDYFSVGTPPGGTAAVEPEAVPGGDIGGFPFVAVSTDGTTATSLHELLQKGPVTVHLGGSDATDLLASFSSHGPAQDSYLNKPDLVAPGVEIRSSWLNGQTQLESGTSMAAPHVAGAAALVLQDHPNWSSSDVSSSLASAAHPLAGYTPTDAGAGRLDVAAADVATVLPFPWSAHLGLASMGASQATAHTTVRLRNVGRKSAHVTLRVRPAAGRGHVTVSPRSLVIPPGGSREVLVHAGGPVTSASYDVSGVVVGAVSSGHTATRLRVPYLMAVRPLSLHPTPDPTTGPETVEIYSEASLATAPTVSLSGPHGARDTTTATFAHDNWWKATLPSTGPAGTYHLTAESRSLDGRRITGHATYDRLGGQGSAHWDSVGPVGDAGKLATSPDNPQVAYLLPSQDWASLVQRTTDGGDTWTPVGEGVLNGGVDLAVAADPSDARTVYVAQGGRVDAPFEGRVMVTHNGGSTWSALPLPDMGYSDVGLTNDGRTIAVLDVNSVVHYSTDAGKTWASVGLSSSDSAEQMAFSGHDLYVSAGSDLWKLPDVGSGALPEKVWTAPGTFPNITSVGSRDGAVAVAGYDAAEQGVHVVAVSTDGGSTWQNDAPNATAVITQLDWVGDDLFASNATQSWQQPDGSSTWEPVDGLPSANHMFAMLGGHRTVSVDGVGVYRTIDGTSYRRIGVAGTMINALAVARTQDGTRRLVAATAYGVFGTPVPEGKATKALRDWGLDGSERLIGKNDVSLSVDPHHRSVVYTLQKNAFSRFTVLKSTDGGQTWDAVESPRTSADPYQVAISPANPSYVYVTEQDDFGFGVLVTTDGGVSWRRYAAGADVTTVTPDPRHARAVWLGGPDGLFRSTDGGQHLEQLSSRPVSSIAVDPRDPSHLVVGGSSIATSHDGGRTLQAARGSAGRTQVSSVAFVQGHAVCATTTAFDDDASLLVDGRGVLCSGDDGRSWHNVSGDLPVGAFSSLAISPDGRWLYAGSTGEGVYRTRVRSVIP